MRKVFAPILYLSLLIHPVCSYGQQEWKNWNTAQLNFSLTKKLDMKLSHMRAFDISTGFNPDFNQSSVHLNYDITKKADINACYTFGGSNSLSDGGSRVSLKLGYKVRLAKVVNWSNSIQGEVHSKSETRYQYRFIYSTRLSPRKRLDFLNLSPSVSYSLYYNIGGNPIQYYDSKTGVPTIKQTADGFHRGRLMLNLNSKISSSFSISVYYMSQQELNLFTPENRRMNIVKPTNGKVVRAFDNFNVVGLTLACELRLYKSKK
ncbi:MAG: DUF2490 domain-containing protein [Bacteroidota bacterium]